MQICTHHKQIDQTSVFIWSFFQLIFQQSIPPEPSLHRLYCFPHPLTHFIHTPSILLIQLFYMFLYSQVDCSKESFQIIFFLWYLCYWDFDEIYLYYPLLFFSIILFDGLQSIFIHHVLSQTKLCHKYPIKITESILAHQPNIWKLR